MYLDQYFEQSANQYPDAVALEQGEKRISYSEVEATSNRLARYLRQQGIGRDDKVILLLPRCAEVIIVMLGILKAGAAYIPLDPEIPADRLNFIQEDAEAKMLITSDEILERIGIGLKYKSLFNLDSQWDQLSVYSSDHLSIGDRTPDDLCYLIYTSGTTGKPKGVMLEHRNVANYLQGALEIYPIDTTFRALQGFSVSFDASVEEI